MKTEQFRGLPTYSKNTNVDRESDTVNSVIIAKHGKNKNGSYFGIDYLNQLKEAGNEQKQGVKCRFGHPNMCTSSLGTFVGRYKNFRVKDNNLYADLALDEITKTTKVKGMKKYDYIMDMAENNADMFGNSVVVHNEYIEKEVDGEVEDNYAVLNSFLASDLVDDPAATDGLFSSDDLGVTVTHFLDRNPEIFESIEKEPELIKDFLERYENYTNKKGKKMSIFDKILGRKEKFDIEWTLANGSIITIQTDEDVVSEGDTVVDEDGNVLEDGDYILENGNILKIEDGKHAGVTEVEEEEDEEEESEPSDFATLNKNLENFSSNVEKALEKMDERFEAQSEAIKVLQRNIKSKKFESPTREDRNDVSANTKEETTYEKYKREQAEKK